MAKIEFQEMPGLNDERKIVIGDRRYRAKTLDRCPTCTDENFLYVRMKLAGGDVVVECPVCDTTMTVRGEMVNVDKTK